MTTDPPRDVTADDAADAVRYAYGGLPSWAAERERWLRDLHGAVHPDWTPAGPDPRAARPPVPPPPVDPATSVQTQWFTGEDVAEVLATALLGLDDGHATALRVSCAGHAVTGAWYDPLTGRLELEFRRPSPTYVVTDHRPRREL